MEYGTKELTCSCFLATKQLWLYEEIINNLKISNINCSVRRNKRADKCWCTAVGMAMACYCMKDYMDLFLTHDIGQVWIRWPNVRGCEGKENGKHSNWWYCLSVCVCARVSTHMCLGVFICCSAYFALKITRCSHTTSLSHWHLLMCLCVCVCSHLCVFQV